MMDDHRYRQYWFNNYTWVEVGSHEATIEKDGTVEVEVEMEYAGCQSVQFSVEDLERLAAMARAMRDYHARQEARDE
ncbi:MAG TPA: hypothetical protein VM487_03940 [Phycisphaerae bacterium]|nr:hypothetical protein [Phycisphaerae bacterium]